MQSPVEDSSNNKMIVRLLGPALGDQNQGSFSVNLWKNAFQEASQRLCPVRAGGHQCGCLPVLARMVWSPQTSPAALIFIADIETLISTIKLLNFISFPVTLEV